MAVTANQLIKAHNPGNRVSYPIVASKRIYAGTLVYSVAASGYATDAIAAGANHFLGIAAEDVDNSSGSSGDKRVECWTEGIFRLPGSSLTQAMVGDKMYGVDNFAINATATSQTYIGKCVEFISSTEVAVKLEVGEA